MNALRNIFNTSTRTFNYLRQNGTNALLNLTQQPVDGINNVAANCSSTNENVLQPLISKSTLIPKSVLEATHFKPKEFTSNGITPDKLSPTSMKRLRHMHQKVELVYLCKICNTRNTKEVSEAAYKNGIVILQCDGCSVNHLICDNPGWFADKKGKNEIDFDQVLAKRAGERRVKVIKMNEHGELI